AALVLSPADDSLETREGLSDLVELVLDVRTARDLADEQAHEVRIVAPRAEDDLDHEPELLGSALARVLGDGDGRQEPAPLLAEDRLEHGLLRPEVVVDEAVRDAGLLRHVPDRRSLVALAREHAHRGVEDRLPLVVSRRHAGRA